MFIRTLHFLSPCGLLGWRGGVRIKLFWGVMCLMGLGVEVSQAQFQPPNPGVPLFGEVGSPQALKYANAGTDDDLLPFEVNGYWGLLNQSGRVVALPEVDWTDVGVEGLVRFTLDGQTGFMLGNGDWRFEPRFAYADRFAEGYAVFGRDGKFGYIDKSGKVRLPAELDAALRFREGRAGVRVGNRCGFIDTRFQPATKLEFTAVRSFHEGFAAVRLPGKLAPESSPKSQAQNATSSAPPAAGEWGFLNKNGKLAYRDTAGSLQALGDFNEGLARFQQDGLWGYMDKTFRVVVPPTYEQARDFTQGHAAVKLDGKWGYLNREYDVVIRFTYDRADDFDESLAMVTLDHQVGFIDRTGRVVIEPQFDWAEPFRLGVAKVAVGESFGYLKSSGHVFYDPRYGQAGIIDVTAREQLWAQASVWERYNRTLRPPPARPTRPRPYPPEYQYDEGLSADPPPGPPPTPRHEWRRHESGHP